MIDKDGIENLLVWFLLSSYGDIVLVLHRLVTTLGNSSDSSKQKPDVSVVGPRSQMIAGDYIHTSNMVNDL